MPIVVRCRYCRWSKVGEEAEAEADLARHVTNKRECRERDNVRFDDRPPQPPVEHGADGAEDFPPELPPLPVPDPIIPPRAHPKPFIEDCSDNEFDDEAYARGARYHRPYPGKNAGEPVSNVRKETPFEARLKEQKAHKLPVYHPFKSMAEWELARWAMKNLGQGQMDSMLELEALRQRTLSDTSFWNAYSLLKKIDDLPAGPLWNCVSIPLTGTDVDHRGRPKTQDVELWLRDGVEVLAETMSHPGFKDHWASRPERAYTDKECKDPLVDEAWDSDWWNETQAKFEDSDDKATLAPFAISTDETKLTNFRGDKVGYPVYLNPLSISKHVRRKASSHAAVLIAYLPADKLECFKKADRKVAGWNLFHDCMRRVLSSLRRAGQTGVEMVCPDGWTRRVYPLLAAYIADYPEQCKVCGVTSGRCPQCTASHKEMSNKVVYSCWRDPELTLEALAAHEDGEPPEYYYLDGLRPNYQPFWEDMPHCNIFQCMTPDIMHELHKGTFWDHMFKWIQTILGINETDQRFMAVPPHEKLHLFRRGVSRVRQWTMGEHKQMQKVFMGMIQAGAMDGKIIRAARGVMEFIYLAQISCHTNVTLTKMDNALKMFHANKDIFLTLGARTPNSRLPAGAEFAIPKIHKMDHYVQSIKRIGGADGTNTEAYERFHIDYAKHAFQATNHRDYLAQMVVWLRRQEAVDRNTAYIEWAESTTWAARPQKPLPSSRRRRPAPSSSAPDGEAGEAEPLTRKRKSSGRRAILRATKKARLVENGEESETSHDTLNTTSSHYHIAKTCPHRGTSVNELRDMHLAEEFLPALQLYVRDRLPPHKHKAVPGEHDRFDVYNKVTVKRPANPYVGHADEWDNIRTVRAVPRTRRKPPVPARFDTALIADADRPAGAHGLQGVRAARVRVIFALPPQFGHHPEPLAYVEWFNPFRRVDPDSGMYALKRSTRRNGRAHGEVVPLSRLVRSCHLMPKPSSKKYDLAWTSSNVLDKASDFWFNWWVSLDMWSACCLPPMGKKARERAERAAGVAAG